MNNVIKVNYESSLKLPFQYSPYELVFEAGEYIITLYGASGGYTTFESYNQPGLGGVVNGTLKLNRGKKLYLYIGGQGTNSNAGVPGIGGYNGGVNGGIDIGQNLCASAGSGGSTDIRIKKGNNIESLRSRIMVAGGGGSAGCWKYAGKGGSGGGIEGDNGGNTRTSSYSSVSLPGGKGGTQTHGSFYGSGSKGEDGDGNLNGEAGGSGGGGYWGGEGGKSFTNGASGSGGGGGSSFISGHDGCIAINSDGEPSNSSIHFSKIQFYNTSTLTGVNSGNGYAIIVGKVKYHIMTCASNNNLMINIILSCLSILVSI